MQVTLKKLAQARTQVTVVFDEQQAKTAEDAAVKGLGAALKVKGFRPGQAPLALLREHLSAERIREETVHQLLPGAMEDIQEKGIRPIVTPRVELTALQPLTLLITLVEKPEVRVDVKKIQAAPVKEGKSANESQLLDLVSEHTKVDLAPELIDEEVRELATGHIRKLEQAGISFEKWLQDGKKSPEDFLKELRGIAEKRLRIRFGISFLMEEWKIAVSDEEVSRAVSALLSPLATSEQETLRTLYQPRGRAFEQFKYQKMVEKVMARLHGHSPSPHQGSSTNEPG